METHLLFVLLATLLPSTILGFRKNYEASTTGYITNEHVKRREIAEPGYNKYYPKPSLPFSSLSANIAPSIPSSLVKARSPQDETLYTYPIYSEIAPQNLSTDYLPVDSTPPSRTPYLIPPPPPYTIRPPYNFGRSDLPSSRSSPELPQPPPLIPFQTQPPQPPSLPPFPPPPPPSLPPFPPPLPPLLPPFPPPPPQSPPSFQFPKSPSQSPSQPQQPQPKSIYSEIAPRIPSTNYLPVDLTPPNPEPPKRAKGNSSDPTQELVNESMTTENLQLPAENYPTTPNQNLVNDSVSTPQPPPRALSKVAPEQKYVTTPDPMKVKVSMEMSEPPVSPALKDIRVPASEQVIKSLNMNKSNKSLMYEITYKVKFYKDDASTFAAASPPAN